MKKIKRELKKAVSRYPLGSYQIGKIAEMSALLYERGIDVIKELELLHVKYGVNEDKRKLL